MPVGIRLTGQPGSSSSPGTTRPGGTTPAGPTPGGNFPPDSGFGYGSGSSSDSTASMMASHAAANQEAVRNAISGGGMPPGMGYRATGLGYTTGGGISANPFNMPLTYAPGTAGFLLRDLDQGGRGGGIPPRPPSMAGGSPDWGAGRPGQRPGGGGSGYDAMRRMADYENRDHDIRYNNMRREADYANRNYDRINRQSGEGGSGRGGGLPFAGMLGLSSTSKLLTGGLELGIAGKIAEEVAFLPQHLMALEGTALGHAAPYWNYRTQAAGMSRAGGFAGEDTSQQFYQGVIPPEWMQRLGLGPQQALDLQQNYGLQSSSADESQKLVEQLGSMKFMPAFGGLPDGQAEASAGKFAKYGIFADTGVGSPYFDDETAKERHSSALSSYSPANQAVAYSAQMVDMMARAQELGLNRSEVMRSIDSTLQTAVTRGGGIGYTPEAIGNELMRYSALPGGRTGEVGASMISAASKFGQGVGSEALPTIAYSGLAQRLQSEGDIERYTEKLDPGFMERIKRNPASAKLLQEYVQARKDGHMPAASQLLFSLFNQSTVLPTAVVGSEGAAASFGPGYQHDLTVANSMGVDPLMVIARNLPGTRGAGGQMNTSRAQQAVAYYQTQGWSKAQATGVAAYYAEETGGSFDPRSFNGKGGGQGAQGMGQWRGDRIANFIKKYGHSPLDKNIPDDQLFREQLEFGQWELTHTEIDAGRALFQTTTGAAAAATMVEQFGRPGDDTTTADKNAIGFANRMDVSPDMTGLPDGMLKAQSMGLAGMLAGSQVSASEAATLIPKLNAAIQAMINGLSAGQQILSAPESGLEHPR